MKLLENTELESMSSSLCFGAPDRRVYGRVESYSCKMAGNDKRVYKQFSTENAASNGSELLALSPPQTTVSPFGPFSVEMCNSKTLFYLTSTLNASFPDYDFTNTRSQSFSKEPSLDLVINSIDTTMFTEMGEEYHRIQPRLWAAIDKEIAVRECSIYSYIPDDDDNPYGEEGSIWSFNYFFYNKRLNRILFFSCRCVSSNAVMAEDEAMDYVDDDIDITEGSGAASGYGYGQQYLDGMRA
eukprot:Opistho-2@8938